MAVLNMPTDKIYSLVDQRMNKEENIGHEFAEIIIDRIQFAYHGCFEQMKDSKSARVIIG